MKPTGNLVADTIFRTTEFGLAIAGAADAGSSPSLTAKPEAGKTYLAQALLTAACRNDYSARFFRTDTLANQLMVLRCQMRVFGTGVPECYVSLPFARLRS